MLGRAFPWVFLGVFITCNWVYHWLALLSSEPDVAARWLYQMGIAAEVVAACCTLLYYCRHMFAGNAREAFLLAVILGIIEQGQTVVCDGLAWGIWPPISNDTSICEHEWGQWPYKVIAAAAFAYLIVKRISGDGQIGRQ